MSHKMGWSRDESQDGLRVRTISPLAASPILFPPLSGWCNLNCLFFLLFMLLFYYSCCLFCLFVCIF